MAMFETFDPQMITLAVRVQDPDKDDDDFLKYVQVLADPRDVERIQVCALNVATGEVRKHVGKTVNVYAPATMHPLVSVRIQDPR